MSTTKKRAAKKAPVKKAPVKKAPTKKAPTKKKPAASAIQELPGEIGVESAEPDGWADVKPESTLGSVVEGTWNPSYQEFHVVDTDNSKERKGKGKQPAQRALCGVLLSRDDSEREDQAVPASVTCKECLARVS